MGKLVILSIKDDGSEITLGKKSKKDGSIKKKRVYTVLEEGSAACMQGLLTKVGISQVERVSISPTLWGPDQISISYSKKRGTVMTVEEKIDPK